MVWISPLQGRENMISPSSSIHEWPFIQLLQWPKRLDPAGVLFRDLWPFKLETLERFHQDISTIEEHNQGKFSPNMMDYCWSSYREDDSEENKRKS